jgi:RNA polymerase sigma-70 factor, ECF subfamily
MQAHDFAGPLRAFVARRAPSGLDPDDIVQEVFVRIHERLLELRDTERLDAWIFQIARNVLADSFRVRRRREALAERVAFERAGEPIDDEMPGGAAELTPCLQPMIARLSPPYRQAIELTELQGVTQAEAARRAGVSVSGMKSRVQRGREQLKQMLLACCEIELDVRGGVMNSPERLRPSSCRTDSMNMTNAIEANEPRPETTKPAEANTGCCGGPAVADGTACCALDEKIKAEGRSGCSCSPAASEAGTTSKKGCC